LEVFIPTAHLTSKPHVLLFLQHFRIAPVYFVLYARLLFCFSQENMSEWPEQQRDQFQRVHDHADFVNAWIPQLVHLSRCIHEVAEVEEHLYSAPLWIEDWKALSEMSEGKRMVVSFKEQRLSRIRFPWLDMRRVEQEEDLEGDLS
jgi:hypothetical protein